MSYQFQLTKINPDECSFEELEKEIKRIKGIKEEYFNLEQSIKIFINSVYGACASPYFVGYNINVAEAVTLQGQDLIKFANKILDEWFIKKWHLDTELHKKLGLKFVNPIIDRSVVVYNDTDSIFSSSIIKTNKGDFTIEELYNNNIINGSAGITQKGHESVQSNLKILNWSKENTTYYVPIRRIIRHKVSKSKWKLKTKSGKEIIVTNDHSMIVFRNNKQLTIKPKDILKTDKILCIN